MSRQSSYDVMGSQVNILYNGQHFVSVNFKMPKTSNAIVSNILKAGTIIAKDGTNANTAGAGANAYGIILKDVDFTNVTSPTENVPVLIHGFVDVAKVTANAGAPVAEAKAALKQIAFL